MNPGGGSVNNVGSENFCRSNNSRSVISVVRWDTSREIAHNNIVVSHLRIIPPKEDRERIIREAHNGKLAGHLRDAKIYGQIGRTYWWPGMCKEVTQLCRACEKCASRHVGKLIKPPLTPIPVKRPIDRIGIGVIKFPRSAKATNTQ